MTSSVKVSAHCSSNKEVHVEVSGDPYPDHNKTNILQNGESVEFTVFDDKAITIKEVLK